MTTKFDELVAKLKEIFQLDKPELDFGVYRIMHTRAKEITEFLENRLAEKVRDALTGNSAAERTVLEKELAEALKNAQALGADPEVLPKVKELRGKIAALGGDDDAEASVYSHLLAFFSRYYDEGDFISKRRYKDNTYAIPYNGEEVKLHWANSDQYYIKTSEYFRDYTFVLPTSRKKVHFVLKDASTEQNNNRAANNMERRFALWEPENEGEQVIEVSAEGDLNFYFTYELKPKTTKQKDLMTTALVAITPLVPADFEEVLTAKAPTKDNPNRTLLESI